MVMFFGDFFQFDPVRAGGGGQRRERESSASTSLSSSLSTTPSRESGCALKSCVLLVLAGRNMHLLQVGLAHRGALAAILGARALHVSYAPPVTRLFARELITGNLTRSVVAVSICPYSRNPETNKSHLHHNKESGPCIPSSWHSSIVHSNHLHPLARRRFLGSSAFRSCIRHRVPLARDPPELDGQAVVRDPLDLSQQRLPQILVLDVGPGTGLPTVLHPRLDPLGSAFDHIFGIGSDDKGSEPFARPVSEAQRSDHGTELGAIAGLSGGGAKRTLGLEAGAGNELSAVVANPMPESPAGLGIGLAVVETSTVCAD